jgi:hypothetical protein
MDDLVSRLMVALGLALEEIHNPGIALANGYDVVDVCEGMIADAAKTHGAPATIRAETIRRARAEA